MSMPTGRTMRTCTKHRWPVLTMVMLVLGIQFFLMGLLAEMQVRLITNRRPGDLCGREKNRL